MSGWKKKIGIAVAVIAIGIIAATLSSQSNKGNGRSSVHGSAEKIPMPMIGGANTFREGPWPQCVGWTGSDCQHWIETYAEDVRGNVVILPEGSMVTADFRSDRVRVFVDDDEVVTQIPNRG